MELCEIICIDGERFLGRISTFQIDRYRKLKESNESEENGNKYLEEERDSEEKDKEPCYIYFDNPQLPPVPLETIEVIIVYKVEEVIPERNETRHSTGALAGRIAY
jgi:hypothetical protein